MGKTIVWTTAAQHQLNQIFLDVFEISSSVEVAEKVTTDIYESTEILQTHSEIYELDELKINNNQNIRAYEKYSYRISYQIDNNKFTF